MNKVVFLGVFWSHLGFNWSSFGVRLGFIWGSSGVHLGKEVLQNGGCTHTDLLKF